MYTAYYRTLMSPTIYSEWDGSYLGMDERVHYVNPGENYYSDMSLWDTFRTQNPWLVLVRPDVARDIVHSLVLMIEQGVNLPRWYATAGRRAPGSRLRAHRPAGTPAGPGPRAVGGRRPIANVYTGCMFGDNANMVFLDTYRKGRRPRRSRAVAPPWGFPVGSHARGSRTHVRTHSHTYTYGRPAQALPTST